MPRSSELEALVSDPDLRERIRRAAKKRIDSSFYLATRWPLLLIAPIGMLIVKFTRMASLLDLCKVFAVGAAAIALTAFLRRPLLRRAIRDELVSRGFAICMNCGYDLRGQSEDRRCPECGREY